MHTKGWRTEQMGSEGWSVFMPNPKLPRFEIVIASNMSEEHARLIAAAPELLEALEKILAEYPLLSFEEVVTICKEAIRKAKGD